MSQQAIQKRDASESLEKVLLTGDLSQLSAADRILYYRQTCESLGLNPLTKPFEYIKLNGKLTLYARKDATDQLRKLHAVSIAAPDIQQIDNLIIVTVVATDRDGRTDSDIGVVGKGDMGGNVGNALMKAVTKAKRRVTLSICGLGMLDETEVETIPTAQIVPAEIEPHAIENEAPGWFAEGSAWVANLCKALNATKRDEIVWTGAALKAFVNEFCTVENGLADLFDDQLIAVIEELEGRLDALQLEAESEPEPASEPAPKPKTAPTKKAVSPNDEIPW
jgi:hypothetical protein